MEALERILKNSTVRQTNVQHRVRRIKPSISLTLRVRTLLRIEILQTLNQVLHARCTIRRLLR